MCCQKCLTVKCVCLETASINSLSLTLSSTCRHQHKQEFKEAFSAQTSVRQHTFGFYRPLLKRFVLCDSRGYQITRELFDVFIKEARDRHVFCPPHILLLFLHSLWVFFFYFIQNSRNFIKQNTVLFICLSSQGERGLDGPRGPRGQPGAGIKGDKVQSAERLKIRCLAEMSWHKHGDKATVLF